MQFGGYDDIVDVEEWDMTQRQNSALHSTTHEDSNINNNKNAKMVCQQNISIANNQTPKKQKTSPTLLQSSSAPKINNVLLDLNVPHPTTPVRTLHFGQPHLYYNLIILHQLRSRPKILPPLLLPGSHPAHPGPLVHMLAKPHPSSHNYKFVVILPVNNPKHRPFHHVKMCHRPLRR